MVVVPPLAETKAGLALTEMFVTSADPISDCVVANRSERTAAAPANQIDRRWDQSRGGRTIDATTCSGW